MEHSFPIIKKIDDKLCTICVLGLGQVGLPTAVSFLKAGFRVVGYDVNVELIKDLLQGVYYIPEKNLNELVVKYLHSKSFAITSEKDVLSGSEVVIICVATPLNDKASTANMSFLKTAIEDVSKYLTGEKLIVIESTIPPRTMNDFVIPTLEQLSGKKAGKDFLISFCPERIAPGNALQEFRNNSRVIGANDENSYRASYSLFKNLTSGDIHRGDTTTVEISKLAENTYRDINIALANELAVICEQSDVDVIDVIRLANTHPRVKLHKPGPGVGGPCLPKDPYLLIMGRPSEQSIVKIARSINDSMPSHVVDLLLKSGHISSKKEQFNVVVLGSSYKADVNDIRHSPTKGIVISLRKEGFANVTIHDPYSNESFGAKFNPNFNSIISDADCVIIATGHSVYSFLRPTQFKPGCVIIDAARLLKKQDFINSGITYMALGM